MKNLIQQIQEDDPSFNPLKDALRRSHTPQFLWKNACDRVYINGMYGPISAQDWKEQDGRVPYYMDTAQKIIKRVLNQVWDYERFTTDIYEAYHDDCELGFAHEHEHREEEVSAEDIKKALVPWYIEIYGGLP